MMKQLNPPSFMESIPSLMNFSVMFLKMPWHSYHVYFPTVLSTGTLLNRHSLIPGSRHTALLNNCIGARLVPRVNMTKLMPCKCKEKRVLSGYRNVMWRIESRGSCVCYNKLEECDAQIKWFLSKVNFDWDHHRT